MKHTSGVREIFLIPKMNLKKQNKTKNKNQPPQRNNQNKLGIQS